MTKNKKEIEASSIEYESLKQRHREIRDDCPDNLNLRVHRALSWWRRANMADDDDGRFIFLWIAFNAAYAYEIDERYRLSEQGTFNTFLKKICQLDKAKRIDVLVWQAFSGSIRVLLDTPFVFQSFWDFQSGKIDEAEWIERFAKGKYIAQQALASSNTPTLLRVVFDRLYTLRNQMIHGGATWDSSVNRQQVRGCAGLLGKLVPLIIELMMDHPDELWGSACYPVINL